MGYKGYVDGVEIFATGVYGGIPCYNGNLFISNLPSFIVPFPTTSFNLTFDFYSSLEFTSSVYAHFNLYYNGSSFTVFNDSTNIVYFDVSTSTRTANMHTYIGEDGLGSEISFIISTSTPGDFYLAETFLATTTGDLYYSWNFPELTVDGNYTFTTSISSTTVLTSTSTVISFESPEPTYSSVLFLPGLKASRLYKEGILNCSVNCEDQLWEPNWDTDVEALFMNPDGTSMSEMVYTRDLMSEAYGTINIYKSFLENLEEMKSVDGTIADYSAVPYDWRLSLEDIINGGVKTGDNISYIGISDDPYIESELRRLASTSDNGKVTIVAHSNGGLVAKALLKKLADEGDPLLTKVDKVIFVAVPHLGTPSAITAMLHGDKQGIPVLATELTARRLGEYLPGGYHLLPSQKYFETVSNPAVTFGDGMDDWVTRFGEEVTSESGLHGFLTDSYERIESEDENLLTPSYLHNDLMTYAETIHESLDSWIPPSTMEIVEIAGWGIPTTISGVEYYEDKGKIKFKPITTIDGDGTVVTPSAHWSNGITASTTKYWVDEGQWNKDNRLSTLGGLNSINHKNILEVQEIISLIEDSIEKSATFPTRTYVFNSVPTREVDTPRLVYSLHSPLTLDIYDSLGNHTGVSTTTGEIEEQIPGTYFIQFGDEKYIFTDTGSPFTISMSGYDSGTFTFKIEQLQGDSTVSSVEFKDIPTTASTTVRMSITNDIQSLSSLVIDSDDDGNSDINLTPVIGGSVTYTPPAPIPEPTPVSVGGNGPPVLQSIPQQIATSTIEFVVVASTTFTQITEVATTTVSTTSPTVVSEVKPKPKQIAQKPKIVVQKPVEMVILKNSLNQSAQVISFNSEYFLRFTSFVGRFSSWIASVFK